MTVVKSTTQLPNSQKQAEKYAGLRFRIAELMDSLPKWHYDQLRESLAKRNVSRGLISLVRNVKVNDKYQPLSGTLEIFSQELGCTLDDLYYPLKKEAV